MRTSAHARPVKIRKKTLFVRHLTQWRQFHLLRNRIQQRAGKPCRAFHLPQSSSSMHSPSKRVQRTNLAERYQLRFLQFRDTADQIINPLERALPPLRHNRSEEHTSELQSRFDLVCRLLLEKKKKTKKKYKNFKKTQKKYKQNAITLLKIFNATNKI